MTSLPLQNPGLPQQSVHRLWSRILISLLFVVLLVGGIGGWIATAELNGAIISTGTVEVSDKLKSVQHREGGIVSQIEVQEGDMLEAGQPILRLDDTQIRAEHAIVTHQIIELTARRARLLAERDNLAVMTLPQDFTTSSDAAAEIAEGELRLFDGQRQNRHSRVQQLELGVAQIGEEINGLMGQRQAKEDELALVLRDHDRAKELVDRGLTEVTKLTTLERDLVSVRGELSEIDSAAARARTRISEINLQILAIDATSRTDAQRELGTLETRLSELNERLFAIEDELDRAVVRAPISGVINELNVHTLGGVVSPAEVLVTMVPRDAQLSMAFRLDPASVEQVRVNADARVRFASFNQRTTPELKGTVSYVSAATTRDPSSGQTYFQGRVYLPPEELAKLGDAELVPGMPVEVYVQTEERTVASYLARPLVDQFSRAFRER